MILLLTGTPGTGKSTISQILSKKLDGLLVAVNDLVEEKKLYNGIDPEKGYKQVDLEALKGEIQEIKLNHDENFWLVVEGHLSHNFPHAEMVIVLRTDPKTLKDRLKGRGWSDSKIKENLEAEALDISTWEAYQIHGDKVQELDTSDINPQETVDILLEVIRGEKSLPVGNIDFSTYLVS